MGTFTVGTVTVGELRAALEDLDGDMPVFTGGTLGSGIGRAATIAVMDHDGRQIVLIDREEP